jgi:ADP-heptose:LPS heptosyltransferase
MVQIGTEVNLSELHNHASPRVPGAIDWINRLSIMETVALLEQSRLFLGIDSGPLHLATTLGIPTIGLFGPVMGSLRAHPRAPFTCLTANVPCLGCHHDPAGELHWRTGCPYDIRCMKLISVDDVFRAVTDVLKS